MMGLKLDSPGGGDSTGKTKRYFPGGYKPVLPYMAIPWVVHRGVWYCTSASYRKNLEIIEENIHAAISMVNINLPVKLVGWQREHLTGFTDETFDLPHALAARELFIDIPGEETERLGKLAKH